MCAGGVVQCSHTEMEKRVTDVDQLRKDLWKRMAQSPFVMVGLQGEHSEPLTAQLDEDQVDTLWFFVGKGNRLVRGGPAMVQFVSKGHDFFACFAGEIARDDDPAMIDKLWSKPVEAWFPGGKDDPSLALLRFDISDAELWEAGMSVLTKVKLLLGRPIDPSEEGTYVRTSTTAA
jgi:general stress protein 26